MKHFIDSRCTAVLVTRSRIIRDRMATYGAAVMEVVHARRLLGICRVSSSSLLLFIIVCV